MAVFTAAWDLLSWNELWSTLLGEPLRAGTTPSNLVRHHFARTALG